MCFVCGVVCQYVINAATLKLLQSTNNNDHKTNVMYISDANKCCRVEVQLSLYIVETRFHKKQLKAMFGLQATATVDT